MKSLKNDVKAWLLLCSGLGTILFLMGSTFYIVISQSLGLYSMGGGESEFRVGYWQAVLNSPVFRKSVPIRRDFIHHRGLSYCHVVT